MVWFVICDKIPQNLSIVRRFKDSIKAEWSLLDNIPEGPPYTYFVFAKRINLTEGGIQNCCSTSSNSCRVDHLLHNTAYNLSIQACITECSVCSKESAPLLNYTKPGAPSNLTVVSASATELFVTWEAPTPNDRELCRYEVLKNNKRCPRADSNHCYYKFTGLSACQSINISIRACAGGDCGPFANLTASTTPQPTRVRNILLAVFIPLIILLLLVLLFVFRKRIPFLRNLLAKKPHAKNADLTLFPIEYYTPPGPRRLANVPLPIPVENFRNSLQAINAVNGFPSLSQALAILAVSEIKEKYRLTKMAALRNGIRNRYSDILPCELGP
ncbi:unnamed protein product [Hydatigera taeniaeformis]|uniref:Fibronectin type-III domain-containing protein n=1 Tax=Hydatigena taeniaeformis TaxID=6205 RepID=A0A0R3X438_HYDTA|nr:unnamed protein product [Hydatigera taeniaeformis]